MQPGDSSSSQQIKLFRLMRLPRLWRILRILRILRLARLIKKSTLLRQVFERLKLSHGIQQLFQIALTVFFLTHIAGCLWFLVARLDDFAPDTWPVRAEIVNSSIED